MKNKEQSKPYITTNTFRLKKDLIAYVIKNTNNFLYYERIYYLTEKEICQLYNQFVKQRKILGD